MNVKLVALLLLLAHAAADAVAARKGTSVGISSSADAKVGCLVKQAHWDFLVLDTDQKIDIAFADKSIGVVPYKQFNDLPESANDFGFTDFCKIDVNLVIGADNKGADLQVGGKSIDENKLVAGFLDQAGTAFEVGCIVTKDNINKFKEIDDNVEVVSGTVHKEISTSTFLDNAIGKVEDKGYQNCAIQIRLTDEDKKVLV